MEYDIIKIRCNRIFTDSDLYSKVKKMTEKCFHSMIDSCCMHHDSCDSHIYMELSDYQINSMVLCIVTPNYNIVELYNTCAHSIEGLEAIIDKIKDDNKGMLIWVGINDIKNEKITNFYTQMGFKNPFLSRNTGGIFKTLPFVILNLSYNPNDMDTDDLSETTALIKFLGKSYEQKLSNCVKKLYFGPQICKYLFNLLKNDFEVAGPLENAGNVFYKNIDTEYINIVFDKNKLITEPYDPYSKCNVKLPESQISFHTHPKHCIELYNCYAAWPSGQDISNLIEYFPRLIKHYVISPEGIYSMQLSLDTQKLLDMSPVLKPSFSNFIENFFTAFYQENRRKDLVQEDDRHIELYQFMMKVGSITFNTVFEEIDEDFNIFIITLFSKKQIEEEGEFGDCLYYMEKDNICDFLPLTNLESGNFVGEIDSITTNPDYGKLLYC